MGSIDLHNITKILINEVEQRESPGAGLPPYGTMRINTVDESGNRFDVVLYLKPDCELVQKIGGYIIGKEKPKDENEKCV